MKSTTKTTLPTSGANGSAAEPMETPPATYKADINVPAEEGADIRLVQVDLNAEETVGAQAAADAMGLTLGGLVEAVAGGSIPGQADCFERLYLKAEAPRNDGKAFILEIRDAESLRRMTRAAEMGDQVNEAFVVEAIESFISCMEERMLLHPVTGALAGNRIDLSRIIRRNEVVMDPSLKVQCGEPPTFLRNGPGKPPLVSVTLDKHISGIARAYLRNGSNRSSAECVDDLVNAAVKFFCNDSDHGETTAVFVARAKARRLGLATPSPAAVAADSDTVSVTVNIPRELYQKVAVMSAYDKGDFIGDTISGSMEGDCQAWLEADENNPTPREYLAEFIAQDAATKGGE